MKKEEKIDSSLPVDLRSVKQQASARVLMSSSLRHSNACTKSSPAQASSLLLGRRKPGLSAAFRAAKQPPSRHKSCRFFHNSGFFANLFTPYEGIPRWMSLSVMGSTKGSRIDPEVPREDAGLRRTATMRRILKEEERRSRPRDKGRPATAYRDVDEHHASTEALSLP